MGAYSNNQDLAFQAAACLSNAKSELTATELDGLPPSRSNLYTDKVVTKAYPGFAPLVKRSIEAAGPRPLTPAYQDVSLAIQDALQPPSKIDPDDPSSSYDQLKSNLEDAVKREGLSVNAAAGSVSGGSRPAVTERSRSGAPPRLDALRPGGDRDAPRHRLPDPLRDRPLAAEPRPPLPRRDELGRALDNYKTVLTSALWWQDVLNTVIIAVVSVAIELTLGMLIALVMYRAIFGRGVVRAAVLIPYGIVTVAAAFAWQFAFSPGTGFVDPALAIDKAWFGGHFSSLAVIIMAEVWKTTPFMALLLLAGLTTIDDGLYEAAKVDGASAVQRFFRITLPLMKPAILVALLFRTLDAFRIFDNIFIMTRGAQNTESVSILGYNQIISRTNLGLGSAVSVLIFICGPDHRVRLRAAARSTHGRREAGDLMRRGTRDYALVDASGSPWC